MESLEELRRRLDMTDGQIIELFQKRMDICAEVGEYKLASGRKVFDKEREQEKLDAVAKHAKNDFYAKGLKELFELLISVSRKLQYQLITEKSGGTRLPFMSVTSLDTSGARVVYQGMEGAYSEAAMKKFFGENVSGFHVATFREAMESIEDGTADFAVLPIENSTAGVVDDVYDLLTEFENYIVGEVLLKIDHVLAAPPDGDMDSVREVYSHPQALMQCSKFLDEHKNWRQVGMINTASAAEKVFKDNDKRKAAICSAYAASRYGLKVLRGNISQSLKNTTRFIVVTNQKIFLKDAKKISICFEAAHESGALYHLLSHFIYNDLNMLKIFSRPIDGRDWEYCFFVDFEGNLADGAVKNAIRGLREEAMSLKILGNY